MGKLEAIKRFVIQSALSSFRPMFSLNRMIFIKLQDKALAGVGMKSEFQIWIGGGISIFTPWLPMARVQVRDSWENDMYAFEIEKGGVILDLGANIGVTSIHFIEKFSPGTLISVEADPDLFANYLERNLRNFNHGRHRCNVILRNSAVVSRIDNSLVLRRLAWTMET